MMRISTARCGCLAGLAGVMGALLTGCPQPPPSTDAPRVNLRTIVRGLSSPVGMTTAGDGSGRLFIVDQVGFVRVINRDGNLLEEPFLDVRPRMTPLNIQYDERGLLGLAFHPNYRNNGRFFVYYSGADVERTVLSEFRVSAGDANIADPASERVLLEIAQPQFNHNGGQLAFGPDGYLYLGSGDGGAANDVGDGHTPGLGNGQDKGTLLGKILRIDVDAGEPYGIPDDNPFAGEAGARPEIFAFGLRNPWQFSFNTDAEGNSRLFVADVGQNLFEEVHIVGRGDNLGWNIREGAHCFDADRPDRAPSTCATRDADGNPLVEPILEYPHSHSDGSAFGTSVIGGFVYRGAAVPKLAGRYVFGDFSTGFVSPDGRLFAAEEASDGTWSFEEIRVANGTNGRINRYVLAFGRDEEGELYVLAKTILGPTGASGIVMKIESPE